MYGWLYSHNRLSLSPFFHVSICAAAAACATSATTQQLPAAYFLPVFDSCEEDSGRRSFFSYPDVPGFASAKGFLSVQRCARDIIHVNQLKT